MSKLLGRNIATKACCWRKAPRGFAIGHYGDRRPTYQPSAQLQAPQSPPNLKTLRADSGPASSEDFARLLPSACYFGP